MPNGDAEPGSQVASSVVASKGDSAEDGFILGLVAVARKYPARTVVAMAAALAGLGGASKIGWEAADRLQQEPVEERAALQALLRDHQVPVPGDGKNVLALIEIARQNWRDSSDREVTADRSADLSGVWTYKCEARDRNYSHGGTARIEMRATPFGPQWHLAGTRQWRVKNGKRDEIGFTWDTTWAAVTAQNEIKYTYMVTQENGPPILGYADGSVTDWSNHKPSKIEGTYYQLPPVDPMYGRYEFYDRRDLNQ